MDVSLFLARVIGLYFVLVSIALIINRHTVPAIINGMMHNAPLQFLLGIKVLIIGILLVVSHNLWTWSWTVLITIIAWLALIKGFLNIAFPELATRSAMSFLKSPRGLYVVILINSFLDYTFVIMVLWLMPFNVDVFKNQRE